MNYRPDIDGLRAFAVLSVVIYHLDADWLPGGFVGVDIFFVISGYLITKIILDDADRSAFSIGQFYARRVRRIFPALVLVLATTLALGWFLLVPAEYASLGKQVAFGAAFMSNFAFWSEAGYFDDLAEMKPLLHLWSLAVEEQFYLFWPALIIISLKRQWSIAQVTICVFALSFLTSLVLLSTDPSAAFFWPFGRLWELLAGSLLVCAERSSWGLRRPAPAGTLSATRAHDTAGALLVSKAQQNIASAAGLFLLFSSIYLIDDAVAFPGIWAVAPVAGATLVVLAGQDAFLNRVLLSNRLVVFAGLISYPLYLWHWPLISFLWITDGAEPSIFLRLSAGATAVLLAALTFMLVERPLRRKLDLSNAWKLSAVLMCVVFLAGLTVSLTRGVPTRENMREYYLNFQGLQRTARIDDHCLTYIDNPDPIFPYCRFSDVGADETVAIIGDSHAHAAFHGIASGLADAGLNTVLVANSGCPPLLGHPTWAPKDDKALCNRQIEELVETILSRSDIKRVLIVKRGPIYFTGVEPSNENYKATTKVGEITLEEFMRGTQSTIDRLSASGRKVYYVSENPELKIHAKYCLERPYRDAHEQCGLQKSDVMARQEVYLSALGQLKNARLIESIDAFCPTDQCILYDDDALLYADDDHLSVRGSGFLFENVIRPILIPGIEQDRK